MKLGQEVYTLPLPPSTCAGIVGAPRLPLPDELPFPPTRSFCKTVLRSPTPATVGPRWRVLKVTDKLCPLRSTSQCDYEPLSSSWSLGARRPGVSVPPQGLCPPAGLSWSRPIGSPSPAVPSGLAAVRYCRPGPPCSRGRGFLRTSVSPPCTRSQTRGGCAAPSPQGRVAGFVSLTCRRPSFSGAWRAPGTGPVTGKYHTGARELDGATDLGGRRAPERPGGTRTHVQHVWMEKSTSSAFRDGPGSVWTETPGLPSGS